MRKVFLRIAWAAAGLLLIVALLRTFVADVYRVGSGSMQPTLFGGGDGLQEHVLVRFGRALDLKRFDLAVVRRASDQPAMVKRVAGLPGESIGIAEGDLVVDGERLPIDAPRPAPIPVFDQACLDLRDHFYFLSGDGAPWTEESGTWRVDVRDRRAGSDAGLMLYDRPLLDDCLSPDGRRIVGRYEVNDAILALEVRLESAGGALRFRLVEEGDTFEARVEAAPDGSASVVLLRYGSSSPQTPENLRSKIEELARAPLSFPLDTWQSVRFANVDNHLLFELGELGFKLTADYRFNTSYPGRTREGLSSLGARVAFGADACAASFRAVRVLRDVYYVPKGEYGVEPAPAQALGPGEYFLLGDNSANSEDSRFFGPVRAAAIEGRPVAVVWPPSRIRRLRGTESSDE